MPVNLPLPRREDLFPVLGVELGWAEAGIRKALDTLDGRSGVHQVTISCSVCQNGWVIPSLPIPGILRNTSLT